jgi:hypothetical protein
MIKMNKFKHTQALDLIARSYGAVSSKINFEKNEVKYKFGDPMQRDLFREMVVALVKNDYVPKYFEWMDSVNQFSSMKTMKILTKVQQYLEDGFMTDEDAEEIKRICLWQQPTEANAA